MCQNLHSINLVISCLWQWGRGWIFASRIGQPVYSNGGWGGSCIQNRSIHFLMCRTGIMKIFSKRSRSVFFRGGRGCITVILYHFVAKFRPSGPLHTWMKISIIFLLLITGYFRFLIGLKARIESGSRPKKSGSKSKTLVEGYLLLLLQKER